MSIQRDSSLRDVAFTVCTALDKGGIRAVLTGGSAATVYAPNACQSLDLDFIVTFRADESNGPGILASLGYREADDHYVHTENRLILEFPRGPLAVGRDLIEHWTTLRDGERILHIITPMDSVRDRLAGFLFWNDRGSLEQAVAVARVQREKIDLDRVARWCRTEGKAGQFEEFKRSLLLSE